MTLLMEDEERRATLAATISFVDEYQSTMVSDNDDFDNDIDAIWPHGYGWYERELWFPLEELMATDSDLFDQIEPTTQFANKIARRQSDERVRSERGNIRIKLGLVKQLKVAKNLQKLLHKSTATRRFNKYSRGGKGPSYLYPPTPDRTDNQICEDLLAGFDVAYDKIDAVFSACSEVPRMDAKMHADQGICREVLASKLLLFEVHTTAAAVWNHFVNTKDHAPYRYNYHSTPKTCYFVIPMLTGETEEDDSPVVGAMTDLVLNATAVTREEELRKSITVMSSDVYGAILNTACHHEQEQCTSVSDLTQARNEKRKRDPEATFRCSLRRVLRCQREHQSSPHGDLPPRWRRSTTSTAPALSRRTGTRSRSPPAPIQKHNVADVFADLLACVEHAYDEMDDVLAAHGLLSCGEENVNKSMINASMHFDTDWGKKTIEVVASRVLPFDVNAVGAAAWRQVLSRVPFRDTAKTPSKNRNRIDKETITESFTITILAATSAQFRVRQVFRRYVQPDSQVVIVSCRELVPVTFSGEPWTTGVQFRERGYTVVRPSKTILEEFSLLQSCCISRAELTETLEADNPKVSALLEFVLSAAKANVAASHQAIENKLLDEALKCS
ncbi:hypothetical protein FI667_g11731, partial [Globisporangium splendens]